MKICFFLVALVLCAAVHGHDEVDKRGWFDTLKDLASKLGHTKVNTDAPSVTDYKLTYFNLIARAEVIRVLFRMANQTFEDKRIELDEWAALKPTFPLGQVPQLDMTVNGDKVLLVQSMSIARYLAREFDLSGKTSLEQAICDMMCDTATDMINALVPGRYAAADDTATRDASIKSTEGFMKGANLLINLNKKGKFILGEEPSLADAVIFSAGENLKSMVTLDGHVADIHKRFSELPVIAEWIRIRPKTPY